MKLLGGIIFTITIFYFIFSGFRGWNRLSEDNPPVNLRNLQATSSSPMPGENFKSINAYVTAYSKQETCPKRNCITASGKEARVFHTIACPRRFVFGTRVEIDKKEYVCEDRTALRLDGRFDIFFGETEKAHEEAIKWGKKEIKIFVYEN